MFLSNTILHGVSKNLLWFDKFSISLDLETLTPADFQLLFEIHEFKSSSLTENSRVYHFYKDYRVFVVISSFWFLLGGILVCIFFIPT